ncbi:MAG: YdcF family protein [Polaromonas sp.]
MELGTLKPLLTSVLMPPLAPLLLALVGLALAFLKKRGGLLLVALSLAALWLVSCHGTAVWLARHALPQFEPVFAAQLQAHQVQAVVVLGGGLLPGTPEYGGAAQPSDNTAARLRYGATLAQAAGLPLAFTGGRGWAADSRQRHSEAEVAARVLRQDYRLTPRWLESQSRDTAENARWLAPLLVRDGVQRIALVTHAWHLPRALAAFERVGLSVVPAPMGYVLPLENGALQWLPSARGLLASREVLRECLGRAVNRLLPL